MMRNKITQIIRICRFSLFPLFFLSVSSSGEESGEKMSVNQFRVGFVEVTMPISWTDVLRSQYSGRILSDFCFRNDDRKANGVVLEIFTWQKLWKSKDLFLKSYDSVEDLTKTNPQFLAGKNYALGSLHGNYLIERSDAENNKKTTISFYVKSDNFTGLIVYVTKTLNDIEALAELGKIISNQSVSR